MRKNIIYLILGVILFSCSYGTREGAVQKSSKSFLHFIGNVENVSVIIDGGEPFILKKEEDTKRYSPHLLYQVTPGKHTVKIYRNNQLIVDRIIFVASSETKEVEIQ
jgi:hypothetical protein